MKRAIELSKNGYGTVNPNPLVGAVIVNDGKIIGEGFHEYFGGPHAEINAINNTNGETKNTSLFVTLEPCSHFGKTPSCSEEIIRRKFAKVIVGCIDPNPLIAGKGIEMMRNAGIEVKTGVLENEIKKLNEVFFKFIVKKLPFVVMKTAMSLDGKIATKIGNSKWISGEQSRTIVHELRNQYSGIMVGINTIIKDDPLLNIRNITGKTKNPIRIIIDSTARIPLETKVLNTPEISQTIVAVTDKAPLKKINQIKQHGNHVIICQQTNKRVDLKNLMQELAKRNIDSILLEGGGTLNYEALKHGIIDKVIAFIAPKIIGGKNALTPVEGEGISQLNNAIELNNMKIIQSGQDIMIEAYLGS